MANTPTQKSNRNAGQLNAFEFAEFSERMKFHRSYLAKYGIPYNAFLLLCLYIARHCTFSNGQSIRTSHAGIADATGTGRNTVRVVMDFLKAHGVLIVVDEQRREGSASEVYRLNRSDVVRQVLGVEGVILTDAERRGVPTDDDTARLEREKLHAIAANRPVKLDPLAQQAQRQAEMRLQRLAEVVAKKHEMKVQDA